MAPKDKDAVDLTAGGSADENATKKKDAKDGETLEATLSEEDRELKERLETCISTVRNIDNETAVTTELRLKALDVIVNELRTATASMTSVPKPLKFLRPHFAILKELYQVLNDKEELQLRARLADVLAVLAMTMGKPEGTYVVLGVV